MLFIIDSRIFTFDTIILGNALQLYQHIKISFNSIQSVTGLVRNLAAVYDEKLGLTRQINNYLLSNYH